MISLSDIDAILRDPRWLPRYGWHDDHAANDSTADYLPAVMQVRAEFAALLTQIERLDRRSNALQLGMGNCEASHAVWSALFGRAITIDFGKVIVTDPAGTTMISPGQDTHSQEAYTFAQIHAPYDFLFIDAGHDAVDAGFDYHTYAPLVRRGGLIAFHDALPRAAYPEVGVHRFLATLPGVTIAGDEVGTAWLWA